MVPQHRLVAREALARRNAFPALFIGTGGRKIGARPYVFQKICCTFQRPACCFCSRYYFIFSFLLSGQPPAILKRICESYDMLNNDCVVFTEDCLMISALGLLKILVIAYLKWNSLFEIYDLMSNRLEAVLAAH